MPLAAPHVPAAPPVRHPVPTPPAAAPVRWTPPDNAAIWRTVQAALEPQMTRQQYAEGVGSATLVEIAGTTVVLRVPTPAAHEQLGVRWRTLLARAFETQLGYPVQLRLVLSR